MYVLLIIICFIVALFMKFCFSLITLSKLIIKYYLISNISENNLFFFNYIIFANLILLLLIQLLFHLFLL